VTELSQPTVGAAGFLAALAEQGFSPTERDGFAIFPYVVQVGRLAGEEIQIGLAIPGDWPMSPPPGPHVNPRLGHPQGSVHASPLGPGWEYWSRPIPNWPRDRTMRAYLRHLRTLLAQS
jgi:hypothetical protein